MQQNQQKPAIILVQPQLGVNIGAAARAMMNCGLTDLRIVQPRDGWPNEDARAMAANALTLVDQAQIFDDFDTAVADLHFLVATTARQRDMVKPVLDPRQAAASLAERSAMNQRCGIMFGPERSGLENRHVARSHALLTVPLNMENVSLNLAQAVLLVGYEWFQITHSQKSQPENKASTKAKALPASKEEVGNLLDRLIENLDETPFFGLPDKRPRMVQNIRNIFERQDLTKQEVATLHGVFKALGDKKRG